MRVHSLVALALLGCLLGFGYRAQGSIVAWYRFEDGSAGAAATAITDSSGNGLGGTAVGGPTYSSNVQTNTLNGGIPNTLSMQFNGSSQRIQIPDYSQLALTHSLSIEALINANSSQLAGTDILLRADDRGGFDPYRLSTNNHGADIVFQICDATNTTATVSAPLPANQWVDVVGTLDDATGTMKLYINGALVSTNVTTIRPFATLDSTQSPGIGIGGLQSGNTALNPEYFNGFIDEVRIADTALAPSQFLTPEPGSIGLMAVFAIGLLPRRRRR